MRFIPGQERARLLTLHRLKLNDRQVTRCASRNEASTLVVTALFARIGRAFSAQSRLSGCSHLNTCCFHTAGHPANPCLWVASVWEQPPAPNSRGA
ncbi:hypothetical protein ACOMHN_066437 [Nucella lapillus]